MWELWLGLALVIGVPWLMIWGLTAARRHRKAMDRIVRQNGWQMDRTSHTVLPPELAAETLPNMGSAETHFSFRVNLTIRGTYRDHPFLLVSHAQARYQKEQGGGTTRIFMQLADQPTFTPLFLHMKSAVLEAAFAASTSIDTLRGSTEVQFPAVSMPDDFSEHYTVRGLNGAGAFMTPERQGALLAKRDIFIRDEERWYHRFGCLPGLTERFAYLDIQDPNPVTLLTRFDMLIDWMEIVEMDRKAA